MIFPVDTIRCSNSELGQTLWKNSGLSKVIAQVSDQHGNIMYEKIMDSFDNPMLRRRWIKSLTNFVAEWISHVSDPVNQQRYLSTAQFVGNSFLKSQGFSKSVMFDAQRPTESLSRLALDDGARPYDIAFASQTRDRNLVSKIMPNKMFGTKLRKTLTF